MTDNKKQLALQLHEVGAVQFGQFMLRSGIPSPVYIDLRRVVSYPALLHTISQALWQMVQGRDFDFLCGVPYAALSFASGMSLLGNKPMVIKRKERKSYGAKRMVEGVYEAGQTCVVVEDIVTSGMSLIDTIEDLEKEGLVVKHTIAIVDRGQGGAQILAQHGYSFAALFSMGELLDILLEQNRIDQQTHDDTLTFLSQTVYQKLPDASTSLPTDVPKPKLRYDERVALAHNAVSRRLLKVMVEKQSNLAVSADVNSFEELLSLAEQVGPYICLLKTHIDNLPDFKLGFIEQLREIANRHRFLLFEDRKFADIGHIVRQQFTSPVFGISEWADMVTVHVVAGASSIEALKDTGCFVEKGMIIIAQMSTKDTLTDDAYLQKAIEIGGSHKDAVMGFVSQKCWHQDPGMLQFTPGVHLASKGDKHGQTYSTPEIVFKDKGADVMIVGRGIYASENPSAAAKHYQQAGWQAYLDSF